MVGVWGVLVLGFGTCGLDGWICCDGNLNMNGRWVLVDAVRTRV